MKKDVENKYGLRHKKTGKILTYVTSDNGGAGFCVDVSYDLVLYGDEEWAVDEPWHAEYVRNYSTAWYNADYESPRHNFSFNELEVVDVTNMKRVDVTIPSYEEYINYMYGNGGKHENPHALKYCLELSNKSDRFYNLYELRAYINKW